MKSALKECKNEQANEPLEDSVIKALDCTAGLTSSIRYALQHAELGPRDRINLFDKWLRIMDNVRVTLQSVREDLEEEANGG